MKIKFAIALFAVWIAEAQAVESVSDLVMQAGWKEVQANCTICHSAQLITGNSGSREVWKSRILSMQETHGMGQLELELENSILDYLATYYGQKAATRRAGLAGHLLPDNPYLPANHPD